MNKYLLTAVILLVWCSAMVTADHSIPEEIKAKCRYEENPPKCLEKLGYYEDQGPRKEKGKEQNTEQDKQEIEQLKQEMAILKQEQEQQKSQINRILSFLKRFFTFWKEE